MAVVRFSEDLKDGIINNAKQLFADRLKQVNDNPPHIADEIVGKIMAEFMPTINLLPREFFHWQDTVDIERIAGKNYSLRQKLAHPWPCPRHKIKLASGATVDGSYTMDVTLPGTPEFQPYAEQLDQWKANIKAIETQRDEFVDGVEKVINAHATLAPALKAWPPLWDLVPEPYKERHRKVVERTKADAPKLDVDLTKLTSTVVATKLVK